MLNPVKESLQNGKIHKEKKGKQAKRYTEMQPIDRQTDRQTDRQMD
jgi:hypothetical protein